MNESLWFGRSEINVYTGEKFSFQKKSIKSVSTVYKTTPQIWYNN